MDILTDQNRRRPAETTALSDIEAALASLSRKNLCFEPALERQYHLATDSYRTRHYQVWLRSMAVVNTPTIFIAAQAEPAHFHLAIFLQWGLIIPACLIGAWIMPRLNPLQQIRYVTALNTLVVFMLTYLGTLAPEPFASRYFMAAGITMMCANIVIPMIYDTSILATLPPAFIYTITGLGGFGGYSALHNFAVIGFMLMLVVFSLRVRRGMEKIGRRSFLLGLRDKQLVDELHAANNRLAAIAATDGLTGVTNRRFFDSALERCWRAAVDTGTPLSVIMVDIDYFKTLNDTAGHASGDECLRQVARTIGGAVRGGVDMVARYGGEEFAVILPSACLADASRVAERVQKAVSDAKILHPGKPAAGSGAGIITVSIGVAQAIFQGSTGPELVLKNADMALYSAKASGRNRVVLAGP